MKSMRSLYNECCFLSRAFLATVVHFFVLVLYCFPVFCAVFCSCSASFSLCAGFSYGCITWVFSAVRFDLILNRAGCGDRKKNEKKNAGMEPEKK